MAWAGMAAGAASKSGIIGQLLDRIGTSPPSSPRLDPEFLAKLYEKRGQPASNVTILPRYLDKQAQRLAAASSLINTIMRNFQTAGGLLSQGGGGGGGMGGMMGGGQ